MTTVAQTSCGKLQGGAEGTIIAFRRVPYALPPTGERRFAPPEPVAAWKGSRDATRNGPIAPQATSRLSAAMGDFEAEQDEDCLTLTIWTPALDDARRPVMVWLHGGAWSSGAGSLAWYDGGPLAAEQGIVVVGVNYRLGALGYLHAPGISPGNLGTMDQIAALRWVRDNIAAFGGDPSCVTVAGQSAGAATIGRLIIDEKARPLFRRAILQSGGFGRPPLTRADAAALGTRYVALLGIDPTSSDAAAWMRGVPVRELIEAQGMLARSLARFADTTPPFMPLVETAIDETALRETIAADAIDLDVLIGSTREEVHAFFAANPAMADPPIAAVREKFVELAGRAEAIDDYRLRRPGATTMDALADLSTDHTFGWPSLRLAEAMAAHGVRVHVYQFDWAPPRSRFQACHCIELPFMFGTLDAWPEAAMLQGGDSEQMSALSHTMRSDWGSFVRSGALRWASYGPRDRTTMVYDEICGPVGDPAGLEWRA